MSLGGTIRTFLAVAIVAAAVPAWAGEGSEPIPSRLLTGVFKPDPAGIWRTITQTDATSDCIGDPVTAMCAIDTWIACGTRLKNKLCDIAVGKPLDIGPDDKPTPDSFKNYRIVSVKRAKKEDIGPFPEYTTGDRKIGDLLVGIIKRSCIIFDKKKPYDSCVTNGMPHTYTMRQSGERWLLIHIHSPRY